MRDAPSPAPRDPAPADVELQLEMEVVPSPGQRPKLSRANATRTFRGSRPEIRKCQPMVATWTLVKGILTQAGVARHEAEAGPAPAGRVNNGPSHGPALTN